MFTKEPEYLISHLVCAYLNSNEPEPILFLAFVT